MEKTIKFKAVKMIRTNPENINFEITGEYESTLEEVRENLIHSINIAISELSSKLSNGVEVVDGIIIMPLLEFNFKD